MGDRLFNSRLSDKESSYSSVQVPEYSPVRIVEHESIFSALLNQCKRNPFVPFGLAGTCYFLCRGIANMGDRELSQRMMRRRVLWQGFTVLALLFGAAVKSLREGNGQQQRN